MEEWTCSCGQKNVSDFCVNCGKPKAESKKSWLCSCGQENTTDFCTVCGKSCSESLVKKPVVKINEQDLDSVSDGLSQSTEKNSDQSKVVRQSAEVSQRHIGSGNMKSNYVIFGVLVVFAFFIGGTVSYLYNADKTEKNDTKIATMTETETDVENKQPVLIENIETFAAETDLSLGGITMGDSLDKVHQILGKGIETTEGGFVGIGSVAYKYPHITVHIKDGAVNLIMTNNDKVKTKRGISSGSTKQEVLAVYGKPPYNSNTNEYELMEYRFFSKNNYVCLLRFAIKGDRVAYISMRNWEEYVCKGGSADTDDAKQGFKNYHNAIGNKDFFTTYNIMTEERKQHRGTYEDFVSSYNANISDEVEYMNPRVDSYNQKFFEYVLTARDKDGGRIKVQKYNGSVTMEFRQGKWYIARAESKKIDERFE